MLSPGNGGSAPVYGHALGHATYERHRPEQTLLYQLVEKHYPAVVEQLEFQGKSLPTHVHREFEAYLKCGRLEHGFLRVRCDNGPEYISQALVSWANEHRITLIYIQPGKPTQNAYIERFNRTARHEWLDLHSFVSLEHAQDLATQWLWLYNNERPNTAIGGVPPRQLMMAA